MRTTLPNPCLAIVCALCFSETGAAQPRLADLQRAPGAPGEVRALADGGSAVWMKDHPFADTKGNLLTVVPAGNGGWWCRRMKPGPGSPIDLSWHAWKEGEEITEVLKTTARWYPKGIYLKAPDNVSMLTCDTIYFGFPGVFEHSIATPQAPQVGGTWKLDGWFFQRRRTLHTDGLSLRVYPRVDGPLGHQANFNHRITVEFAGTGPDDRPIVEQVSMFRYDGKSMGKATRHRFKTLDSVRLVQDEHDPAQDDHFAKQGIKLSPNLTPMGIAVSGTEVFHFLEGSRPFTLRVKDNPDENGLLFFLIDPIDVRIGGPKLNLNFHGGVDDMAWGRCNPLDKIGTWALQVPGPKRYGSLAWGILTVGRFGAGIAGERFEFSANTGNSWNCVSVFVEASGQGPPEEGIAAMKVSGHWRDGMLNLRNMHREGLTRPVVIDNLVLESTTDPYWDGSDFRRRGMHGWGVRNVWPTINWWEGTGQHTVEHQVADWQPVGVSGTIYPPAKGIYPGCWAYGNPDDPASPMYLGGGYVFDVLIQSRGTLKQPTVWETGDDLSQITFRVDGTDDQGRPISRTLRGPGPDQVTRTDRVFKTVTRAMAVEVPPEQEARRVAMTRGPKMCVRMMDPPRIGGNNTPVVGRIVLRGGKTGMGVFNMAPNVDVSAHSDAPGLQVVFDRPGEIVGTGVMMNYIRSAEKQDGTSGTSPTQRVKYTLTQTPESTYAPRWMYQAGGTGASFMHATFVYDHYKGSLGSLGCDGPQQVMGDIEHTGTIDYATFRFPDPPESKGPSAGQASGLVVYGRSRAHDVVAPMLALQDFSSRYQVLCDSVVENLTILPAKAFPDEEGIIHVFCHAANPKIADEPVATNITVRRVRFSDGGMGIAPAGDRIVFHRWNARPVGIGGKGPLVFEDIRIAPGSRIVVNWSGNAQPWKPGAPYARYDVIRRDGAMFFSIASHTSGQTFDAGRWAPFDPNETNIALTFNGVTVTKLPYSVQQRQ